MLTPSSGRIYSMQNLLLLSCLHLAYHILDLKMETARSSKMSVNFYLTTRRHIPEYSSPLSLSCPEDSTTALYPRPLGSSPHTYILLFKFNLILSYHLYLGLNKLSLPFMFLSLTVFMLIPSPLSVKHTPPFSASLAFECSLYLPSFVRTPDI
jgi:hypothetical protein